MDVFCHCIANTSARVGWDDPGLRFNLQGGRGRGSGTEVGGRSWEALLACVRSYLLSARGARRRAVTDMRGRPRRELPLDLQDNAHAPRHSQRTRADARPDQAAHDASRYTAMAAPAAGLTQVTGQCR